LKKTFPPILPFPTFYSRLLKKVSLNPLKGQFYSNLQTFKTFFKMSQMLTENDDNLYVVASDFVQLEQPDEIAEQEEMRQQQGHQFGLRQNQSNWTIETGNTRNYDSDLKEHKLMIANLEVILRKGTVFTCNYCIGIKISSSN
jgi:hypothetical protein